VALAAAGTGVAVLSSRSGSASVRHAAAAAGNGTDAGRPIVIHVGPGSGVTVRVPKVGTLVAAKGSFSSPGTMTITTNSATPPTGDGVTVAGPGVDVTFNGTKLIKPVTLAFLADAKPSPSAVPVIAHRADNGQWNYIAASIGTGGMLTGATSHFSLNVPAWVASIGQWVRDVGQWVGQRLASALAGRPPPLTCSGPPSWFHVASGHSDLVHVCAKDAGPDSNGVDRAEIQIKSNRGVSIQVNVPGNPQYVWVEDQPWPFRQVVMDSLGQDPNRTVILPAGATMTIGYVRTPQSQDLTATVSSYTGLALLDTVIRQALAFALPTIDPIFAGYVMFECASGFKPAAVTATPNFSDDGIAGVLNCMFHEAIGEVATDDHNAENIATQIGAFVEKTGQSVSAETIEATAKLIRAAAVDVSILLPALQDSAGNLWDAVQSWYTGGVSNEVNYSIDGSSPAGTNGPITVGPGGLQGGNNTGPGIQGGNGTGPTSQGGGSTSSGGTGSGSPSPSASPTPAPQQHVYYDNYGATTQGVPMCRGNQGNPASMPGGTVTQTFTANANGTINSTKVQIDPDNTVTAAAVLNINGTDMASNSEPASGDVVFTFSQVAVKAGDTVSLRISFTATYGKIITVYQVGNPGGTFSVANFCPDGAPTFTRTDTGLRAVVSGMAS
jgi:hypothetical protein